MPNFKVISGNFAELYPTEQKEYSLEENKADLAKDLPRTCYFAENLTKEEIKKRLETQFFSDGKKNVFRQGAIDGGMLKWSTTDHYHNAVVPYVSNAGIFTTEVVDQIRVCYVNDHDVLCGFSIQIFQDLNSQSPTTFHYALAIYQDITNLPEERNVTYIVDPTLLNKNLDAQNLPATKVLNVLKEKLQSTVLYEAIAPIIASQHVASKAAFDELNDTLRINENSYEQIQELNKYRKQLDTIRAPRKDKVPNQSFLKRHSENLLLITASVLLGIGTIVALMLFTAPLAATIAAALIITSAAIVTGITAVKCWRDEKSLNTYKTKRDEQISEAKTQYDKQIEKIRQKLESPKPTSPNSSNDRVFPPPIGIGVEQAKNHSDVPNENLTQTQNSI